MEMCVTQRGEDEHTVTIKVSNTKFHLITSNKPHPHLPLEYGV